jgi:3-oxoadipate enol-lactonase
MAFGRFNQQVLHFRDDGPGNSPALVFANSLGTDFRIWDRVAARLGTDFRILRYDLRGHGLSDAPPAPYALADHVADLAALMSARGINEAIVIGLSVGGQIAQGLAAAHPNLVRRLILCDTAHRIGSAEMWQARIEAVRAGGIVAIADAILERWFSKGFRENSPVELAGHRNMLVRTPIEGYAGTCAALRDADLTASTGRLTLPCLCLVGAEDGATPPDLVQSMSALIRNAIFEIVPGAGHLPCIEQPDLVAARIKAFARENACA